MKSAARFKDFFGINHLTNKDVGGLVVRSKLQTEHINSKFGLLMVSRECPENKEIVHDAGFGKARYDVDNVPRSHGQYEPRNTNMLFSTIDIKQRFNQLDNNVEENKSNENKMMNETSQENNQEDKTESNRVSENNDVKPTETIQICELGPEEELSKVLAQFLDKSTDNVDKYINRQPLTFYFDNPSSSTIGNRETLESDPKLSGRPITNLDEIIQEASEQPAAKSVLNYDPNADPIPIEDLESMERTEEDPDEFEFDKSIEAQYSPRKDVDQDRPRNALEYLKDIRSGRTKPMQSNLQDELSYSLKPKILLDSHGFKNYSRQVPDWENTRREDILNHLKGSIIYHNYDVLAVNKPYGIPSHGDYSRRQHFDMNNLMQELANRMKIKKVYLAHRLDMTTTGVLLFATSQKRADDLNKLFKSDQIKKTYWCITKGVPDPEEGIIDIPIGEYSVNGKIRSCLAPERIERERQMTKRYREARRAITEYSLIQSRKQVSLVEVKPRTGVKHQIRCHFGFGLNRPILGDHKYSHLGKLAPQELPVPVLNLLHLRQAKVRTLPMHLHAKTVVVPSVKPNGQPLFIEAPLSQHFKENLKALGLLSREVIRNL